MARHTSATFGGEGHFIVVAMDLLTCWRGETTFRKEQALTQEYEPPLVVELGSVADFTEGNLGWGKQDRTGYVIIDFFLS
jgi:hypothetical protein